MYSDILRQILFLRLYNLVNEINMMAFQTKNIFILFITIGKNRDDDMSYIKLFLVFFFGLLLLVFLSFLFFYRGHFDAAQKILANISVTNVEFNVTLYLFIDVIPGFYYLGLFVIGYVDIHFHLNVHKKNQQFF